MKQKQFTLMRCANWSCVLIVAIFSLLLISIVKFQQKDMKSLLFSLKQMLSILYCPYVKANLGPDGFVV